MKRALSPDPALLTPAKLVLVVLVVLVCYSCSYWQCSLAVLRESACDTVLQSQGWCRGR